MSSGSFVTSKYELDDGRIVSIRIQPETITTVNTVPSAAYTANMPSAKVSKGKREIGIGARYITIKWTGTIPDGYKETGLVKVPILQKSVFDGLSKGDSFTYLGGTAQVVSKAQESIK